MIPSCWDRLFITLSCVFLIQNTYASVNLASARFHRVIFLGDRLFTNHTLSHVLPPLEVLLVCFEIGIHLEKAAELRNCNIILRVCHGFSRQNQSSTDRCWLRALCASLYCPGPTNIQVALCQVPPITTCSVIESMVKRKSVIREPRWVALLCAVV